MEAVKEVLGEDILCEGCGPANEGYMLISNGIPTICGYAMSEERGERREERREKRRREGDDHV